MFSQEENPWLSNSKRFTKGQTVSVVLKKGGPEVMTLGQDTVLLVGNQTLFKGKTLKVVKRDYIFLLEEV